MTGDPITGEKSYSRHSHCMSLALMHCGNFLTIQFQAQTPAVYTVPQLLPSPNRFTFIRPHTSIKGRMEGIRSSCQTLASKVWGSGGESKREREWEWRGRRKKEEPGAFQTITILREFRQGREAVNVNFVWVQVQVCKCTCAICAHLPYIHWCVFTVDGKNKHRIKRDILKEDNKTTMRLLRKSTLFRCRVACSALNRLAALYVSLS